MDAHSGTMPSSPKCRGTSTFSENKTKVACRNKPRRTRIVEFALCRPAACPTKVGTFSGGTHRKKESTAFLSRRLSLTAYQIAFWPALRLRGCLALHKSSAYKCLPSLIGARPFLEPVKRTSKVSMAARPRQVASLQLCG